MTLREITTTLDAVKHCSEYTVKRYLRAAGVKPIKVRDPLWGGLTIYPDDAAAKVLVHLGVEPRAPSRIPTLNQLRAIREKAQRARGK